MKELPARVIAVVVLMLAVLVAACGEKHEATKAGEIDSSAVQSGGQAGEDPPAPTPWSDPSVLAGVAKPYGSENEIRSGLASHNVRHELIDDPARDGWTTETLSDAAQKRLYQIIPALLVDTPDRATLEPWLDKGFTASGLRPEELQTVFTSASVQVKRPASPPATEFKGLDGLMKAQLVADDADRASLHLKVKTWGVTLDKNEMLTRHYIALHDDTGYEQNSEWSCTWKVDVDSGELLLHRIDGRDFEEVFTDLPDGRLFADCTRSVLGKTAHFDEQIMPSIHKWLMGIDISIDPDFEGMQGLAIADVNGDGLEDLYASQGGGLPNRLYLQNADGTVRDATAHSGADFIETTRSALLVDLDNDADPDLVLGTDGMLVILENDGTGHFDERRRIADITLAFSLAVADYDVDGDLDIYATRHFSESHRAVGQLPNPVPYHDANNGGRNVLLRNDGQWAFTDVTTDVGLDENNRRWSYAASWEDYDQDGDLDLYVANDFGRNNLYRNDGGRFHDVAAQAGVEDIASGMSVSWGDYDGDGWSDLYVSNMFSAAGSRITYQRAFQGDASDETRAHYQRLARGNTLFRNLGNGTFEDVSIEAAVTMGRWAWGSGFFDINNDGLQDIVVGNGYVTGDDTGDL